MQKGLGSSVGKRTGQGEQREGGTGNRMGEEGEDRRHLGEIFKLKELPRKGLILEIGRL